MAGSVVHHSPNLISGSQRQQIRPILVDASVSMMGQTFRTMIKEGASAEELIEKIARENNGGVARVFYPEFNTWEIVAVKIGDRFLVKGDPSKVAEADFSQFQNPDFVRSTAISASYNNEGGIHFSLGLSGIPMAVTADQGIVFPNAEELRVGKNTSNIALWMTSVNVNPMNLADLNNNYSNRGGISISEDARKKIAEAHGGVRSEKLMLDENLLVLNKDTGEVSTVSSQSMNPLPIADSLALAIASTPASQPSEFFDASLLRLPLFFVKTFDGKARDHITVMFNPVDLPVQAPKIENNQTKHDEAICQDEKTLKFALLMPQPPKSRKPDDDPGAPPPIPPTQRIRAKSTKPKSSKSPEAMDLRTKITPQKIESLWLAPRSSKIDIPSAVSVAKSFTLKSDKIPSKVEKREEKPQFPSPECRTQAFRRDDYTGPIPQSSPPAIRLKSPKSKKIRKELPAKIQEIHTAIKKTNKQKTVKKSINTKTRSNREIQLSNPKVKPVLKSSKKEKFPQIAVSKRKIITEQKAIKKPTEAFKKDRTMNSFFYRQLLGLFSGRSVAGNSRRRRRAPRS